MLRRNECHIGQGYLLGRPQAPEDLKIALDTGHISLSNRLPSTDRLIEAIET